MSSEKFDAGKTVSIPLVVSADLLKRTDEETIEHIRSSGKKFQRPALIRALMELAHEAIPYIDVTEISDETSLRRELAKAISLLQKQKR